MGSGRDRTREPWICSQTRICFCYSVSDCAARPGIDRIDRTSKIGSIDGIIKYFITFIYDNGEQAFGINKQYVNSKENFKHSEWFDDNCQKVWQDLKTARNEFSRDRNEENRNIFVKTRTQFNRIKRQGKNKFKRSEEKMSVT